MKNNNFNLIIRAQNLEEEFNYLWRVIKDLSFYEKNNYTVSLPENKLFLDLIKEKKLNREKLFKLFEEEIYDPRFFKLGIENFEKCRPVFDEASEIFEEMNKKWGFKLFKECYILLTAYGPGGCYAPYGDIAKVIVLTDLIGNSKIDPIENVIDEMIHLGIEENVVEKFKLEHWEKEALVDSICFLKFKKLIPNYIYQTYCRDIKIQDYMNDKTVEDIPKIIGKYVNDFPR